MAAADYEIDSADPFDTKFKFSRFGLAYAPPRNVSSLTGLVLPRDSSETQAGATNDNPDGA